MRGQIIVKIIIRICNATPHRNKSVLLYDDGKYAEGFVLSHDMSKSNNTYHALRKNPDITDDRITYISHQLRKGKIGEKELFGVKTFKSYIFDETDAEEIELMYKAKKEGKPWNYYINKKTCHTVESNKATTTVRAKCNKYRRKNGYYSRKK